MSDAIQIAKSAPLHIESLLAEMFAANATDNRICLGGVYSGQQYIQIQLVVTSNPAQLMDDTDGDDEHIEAVAAPVQCQLVAHWQAAMAEFIPSSVTSKGRPTAVQALLTLGSIRALYWLALGQGETALAKDIAGWWEDCAPLHGLGEVFL